jgi:hypothetical protein
LLIFLRKRILVVFFWMNNIHRNEILIECLIECFMGCLWKFWMFMECFGMFYGMFWNVFSAVSAPGLYAKLSDYFRSDSVPLPDMIFRPACVAVAGGGSGSVAGGGSGCVAVWQWLWFLNGVNWMSIERDRYTFVFWVAVAGSGYNSSVAGSGYRGSVAGSGYCGNGWVALHDKCFLNGVNWMSIERDRYSFVFRWLWLAVAGCKNLNSIYLFFIKKQFLKKTLVN